MYLELASVCDGKALTIILKVYQRFDLSRMCNMHGRRKPGGRVPLLVNQGCRPNILNHDQSFWHSLPVTGVNLHKCVSVSYAAKVVKVHLPPPPPGHRQSAVHPLVKIPWRHPWQCLTITYGRPVKVNSGIGPTGCPKKGTYLFASLSNTN